MDKKRKANKFNILFVALIVIAGLLLMYTGNDALVLATEKKEGILTAEQVQVSFDSVGGRLVNEAVKEAQEVRKGEVLMVLDSTDIDLSIQQIEAQLAQLEAQIQSAAGTAAISMSQADTDEQQSFRQIDQQRAAVSAAEASYANRSLDYQRKLQLVGEGAVAQAELDNARMALDVAAANVIQQKQLLSKLLAGVYDSGDTDSLSLPTIELQRQSAGNRLHDVEALRQQKRALEVQLKELQVKKERLTLRAPEDGRILKILAKAGEMVSANTPVILMESKRYYYDIYISEDIVDKYKEGDSVTGVTVNGEREVPGTIRLLTQAPGFADLKMTREKGQSDLTAFQVRIYTEPVEGVIPGMTIGVKLR